MTLRLRQMFVLALASFISLGLVIGLGGDTARAATRSQAPVIVRQAAQVAVKATPKRHTAMHYAKAQTGDPYRYGATGPSSWDCSGLVMKAYAKAGISLPRTTGGMLGSSKLVRTSSPKWGDLAFFGSGHVEFYTSGSRTKGYSFGAHKSGTRVSYRPYSSYYHPTAFYHVKGAG